MSHGNSRTTMEVVEGGSYLSRSPPPSACIASGTEPRPPSPTVGIVRESSRPPSPTVCIVKGEPLKRSSCVVSDKRTSAPHHGLRGERGRGAALSRPLAERLHRDVFPSTQDAQRMRRDGGAAAFA
ncbi:hypothetical protein HPB50_027398 [Hyalomma asiaticum]|uniref:Uncharacterized protein n=1 Tax=Hyalomma asiaticum TaxID=266040 RepID=A0ACB7RS74_HYAAI|nr:hypothetical protein HPB50_027398 [Hyalomma asiaticum]